MKKDKLNKEDIIKNLALYISKIRESHGYSMERLAKLSGLSLGYISQLENGTIKSIPKVSTLDALSKAFGMPIYKLQRLADYLTEEEYNALSDIDEKTKSTTKENWKLRFKSELSELGFKNKYVEEIIQYIQTVKIKQDVELGSLPEFKSSIL